MNGANDEIHRFQRAREPFGVHRHQVLFRVLHRQPDRNRGVFCQDRAIIAHQRRHLALGVQRQILGRFLFLLGKIHHPHVKRRADLFHQNMDTGGTGFLGVAECGHQGGPFRV